MINWLARIFVSRVKELESEVVHLKNQLDSAQENLNKTNAYWKRKLYNATKNKSKEAL